MLLDSRCCHRPQISLGHTIKLEDGVSADTSQRGIHRTEADLLATERGDKFTFISIFTFFARGMYCCTANYTAGDQGVDFVQHGFSAFDHVRTYID